MFNSIDSGIFETLITSETWDEQATCLIPHTALEEIRRALDAMSNNLPINDLLPAFEIDFGHPEPDERPTVEMKLPRFH